MQKSPIKETIFCERAIESIDSIALESYRLLDIHIDSSGQMIALEIHIHMDIDSHMEMQRLYEYVLCNLVVRCVDSNMDINLEIHIHIAIAIVCCSVLQHTATHKSDVSIAISISIWRSISILLSISTLDIHMTRDTMDI